MGKTKTIKKHEIILRFNTSRELWEFAKRYQDKIVSIADYEYNTWEKEDGKID